VLLDIFNPNSSHPPTPFSKVILYSLFFNMVVFSKITAGLACISLASAVPMGGARKSSFTVNQLARPATGTKTLNLPGMYANALTKYGASVPASVKAAAVSGSAVTTPENDDEEYLTPVNVGGTTLNLDFDTGSADL
jgi:aspergillopepsin I